MTNVDFFRGFATTNSHYFEHDRQELDFSNLFDADGQDDSQLKIFHFTAPKGINVIVNESGTVEEVRYKGVVYALYKSDLDEVIDTQKGVAESLGKYTVRVKSLIDGGGIISEINDYNHTTCTEAYTIRYSGMSEVYNLFDCNMDGVMFDYELIVKE